MKDRNIKRKFLSKNNRYLERILDLRQENGFLDTSNQDDRNYPFFYAQKSKGYRDFNGSFSLQGEKNKELFEDLL